ncbi:MAG: alpha-ribazole phosphatase family protein [Chromatiales bacterium]|nr:alpha-ribazole phosphatase family protein [Gammaproteobacteria bacterium]MCP5351694.1 alpha-ribazole phosphatase family protein [Chromatiales bacterium]
MQDTVIDLIRHGEPVGGRAFRGHGIDDPLSEKGWSQMWAAVGDANHWDVIVTSPLARCRAFADQLGARHALPVHVDDKLREVGFGSWEGRTPDELQADSSAGYDAFYADPVNNRPAGAEPLPDFGARVAAAIDDILFAHATRRVLVVAHAGVIRAALGHAMQTAPAVWYRARVDNAGLTRLRATRHGLQLDFHNRRRLD